LFEARAEKTAWTAMKLTYAGSVGVVMSDKTGPDVDTGGGGARKK
jgi:hypothetical protein